MFVLKYFQPSSIALNIIQIAIIIDIFETPLVSDATGIVRAVDITIRGRGVVFINFGPFDLAGMRSFLPLLVVFVINTLFTTGDDVVRTDVDEMVDRVFPAGRLDGVDVTFTGTNFFGTILGATVVFETAVDFFNVVGIDDVDLVVGFEVELFTRPDGVFFAFADGAVVVFGLEVFNVEFDAWIEMEVPTVFAVVISVVGVGESIYCVVR